LQSWTLVGVVATLFELFLPETLGLRSIESALLLMVLICCLVLHLCDLALALIAAIDVPFQVLSHKKA